MPNILTMEDYKKAFQEYLAKEGVSKLIPNQKNKNLDEENIWNLNKSTNAPSNSVQEINEGGWGRNNIELHEIGDEIMGELKKVEPGSTLNIQIEHLEEFQYNIIFDVY